MGNAVKIDHPHIIRLPGVCGGEPIVDGLRVTVRQVATLRERGESIQEIGEDLGLTEAQVYHALSYFFDHRERDHRADRSRRTSPCPIHPALKRFSLGYTLIATSWLAWLSICGPWLDPNIVGHVALDPERVIQHSPGSRTRTLGNRNGPMTTLKGLHNFAIGVSHVTILGSNLSPCERFEDGNVVVVVQPLQG